MTMHGEEVALIWTPRGRDGLIAVKLLAQHALGACECASIDEVVERMPVSGCLLLTTEALTPPVRTQLGAALAAQPPWSDFPIILFAASSGRAADAALAVRLLGNVTVLERPIHVRTLVSAVTTALRGRRRQYQAREAIRGRDQFLAMLGHELRNPLAAIMLALEMLHSISGNVGTKQREIIDRQLRHLARLVDDLLDVARVTSGKITLRRDPIDLNDVARRCIESAELAARDRRTEVHGDLAGQPLVVQGDLVRLEEILNNLLGNAIKYSPRHAHVTLTSRAEHHHHVIEVTDNGVGMTPEVLANVFELFAQADRSLDRREGGLGIGLTLVKSLVELHGGTVAAFSEGLGKGSRFVVRFPAIAADVSACA